MKIQNRRTSVCIQTEKEVWNRVHRKLGCRSFHHWNDPNYNFLHFQVEKYKKWDDRRDILQAWATTNQTDVILHWKSAHTLDNKGWKKINLCKVFRLQSCIKSEDTRNRNWWWISITISRGNAEWCVNVWTVLYYPTIFGVCSLERVTVVRLNCFSIYFCNETG